MIEKSFFENALPCIMFDTNTYRYIIDGTGDHKNAENVYVELHNLIKTHKIEAFLSATMFTIEAIIKKDRLAFMSRYNPKIYTEESQEGNTINIQMTLGPDLDHMVDFEGTEPLGDYFHKAIELGFKLVKLPRICGVKNAEITDDVFLKIRPAADYDKFILKASEVGDQITSRGAGMAHIIELLSPYDAITANIFTKFDLLFHDVNKKTISQRKVEIERVAKSIAELSDGDSVAASIGLECDAFCTNDRAINAGVRSVFSEENVNWLKEQYRFNKLTPTELIEFLHSIGVSANSEAIE